MKPRIDYDELVRSYHESLTTVLRGFNAGAGFLDTWVPDDDPHKSILNLIESGGSAGLDGIIISIGAHTRKSLDLAKLKLMIESIGTIRTDADGEALVLEVHYE